MQIIYTESALAELEKFQNQHKRYLEQLLKDRKYVFGDEIIEITASDIKEAEKSFILIRNEKSRAPITSIIFKLYFVVGITMAITGLFYPYITELLNNNPKQIALVLGGILLTASSFFGNHYIRLRHEKREELKSHYIQYESRFKPKNEYNEKLIDNSKITPNSKIE